MSWKTNFSHAVCSKSCNWVHCHASRMLQVMRRNSVVVLLVFPKESSRSHSLDCGLPLRPNIKSLLTAWKPRTFLNVDTVRAVHSRSGWFRQAPLQNYEKLLLALSCLSVCMEQLGSHWTDFHEILYWKICRKTVEKIACWIINAIDKHSTASVV